MDAITPTMRCPGCGLIHYGGLWYLERRARVVRYRPRICPACQLKHLDTSQWKHTDWGRGDSYPSGRAGRWGWARQLLQPIARWFKGSHAPAGKPAPGRPRPKESGAETKSLVPRPK